MLRKENLKKIRERGVGRKGSQQASSRALHLCASAQRQSGKETLHCHGAVSKDSLEIWALLLEPGLKPQLNLWHFSRATAFLLQGKVIPEPTSPFSLWRAGAFPPLLSSN